MRRFLSNLARDFRTKTTRSARRAPQRVNLGVECLDERVLLSSASLTGSILTVNADPGTPGIVFGGQVRLPVIQQVNFEADAHNSAILDVSEGSTSLGQFPIAQIKNVVVNLVQLDNVNVIDSNGLPFAHGSTITLNGSSNFANSLNLTGTRSVSGNETYAVGATAARGSSLLVDNLRFDLTSNIGSVTDSLKPEVSTLTVSTSGQDVSLSGSNGMTQTLSGLGQGGGGTFTFSNVNFVQLDEFASNADVALGATAAAAGQHFFSLTMFGSTNDQAFIQATPSAVTTSVVAAGNAAFVNLLSNSGPVTINGSSSTIVNVGEQAPGKPGGLDTTAGINANVSVSGAGHLLLADSGNTTTAENVTVTDSTISGTGLFGNNAVTLTYSNTDNLAFLTGQMQDNYTFVASQPDARFVTAITVDDFSRVGLSVTTELDAGSGLVLNLNNNLLAARAPASLTILAANAAFSNLNPPLPSGIENVLFQGGLTSTVEYEGFTSVNLFNSAPHQ
jgi:hypothetical protein